MSQRIKKQAPLLNHLAKAKPAAVKAIINTGDKELINVLCECALNVLNGNVRLTKNQKARLCRHKTGIREISLKNTSLKKKRDSKYEEDDSSRPGSYATKNKSSARYFIRLCS